jgi:hypothetical protein
MSRICVFCGSNSGSDPQFTDAAREVGQELVRRGHGLVYGGGRVGLMGVLADATLAAGGDVIGVIPEGLARKEVAHAGVSDMRVVNTMHERKALMSDLSDGFLALPGGLGTLDEFFEICTWAQLGIHRRPCGLHNVGGYFDALIDFLDHVVDKRFLSSEHRQIIMVETSAATLLDRFETYVAPVATKWIDREER